MAVTSNPANPVLKATIGETTMSFVTVEEKFEALVEAWIDECPGSSVLDYDSFFYNQIIGMGSVAVPLLLDKLRAGEGQWVYALECITGEQASTKAMDGNVDAVIQAWLQWGDQLGGRGHGRISA